jgi:hypothetical protein
MTRAFAGWAAEALAHALADSFTVLRGHAVRTTAAATEPAEEDPAQRQEP